MGRSRRYLGLDVLARARASAQQATVDAENAAGSELPELEPQHDQQREHDLATLAAGDYTGWWDDHGQPVPWPDDFFDPDTEWRPDTNNPPNLAPGEHPLSPRAEGSALTPLRGT